MKHALVVMALLFALLTAGPTHTVPVAAVPSEFRPPERGFVSSRPGETWEQGLLSGNGTIGASVLGQPLDDTIVFSHERLFLPERPPTLPPDTGPRLFEIRRLIDQGLYRAAEELAFNISGQESFLYPDPFVPAFDLRLRMDADMQIVDYARSVNFQTGEATVRWTGATTSFQRTLFVSRADGVAVLRITASEPGSVNCSVELRPRDPGHQRFRRNIGDVKTSSDPSWITYTNRFTNAYPGSIQTLEGVASIRTRKGASGVEHRRTGASPVEESTVQIKGADEVLVVIDISPIYTAGESRFERTKQRLSALPDDYNVLLARHTPIHAGLFNRARLDVGGAKDHHLTSEQLIAKSTDAEPSLALIEKQFDAGRYNIISSTGELPPTLQGVWAGTYDPPWAGDYTHNGNVPSAISSLLTGNTPELMRAYTSYIESIVPYLEMNAQRIFNARGVVLPSRSTTNGFNNALAPRFAGAFWVAGAPWAAHYFYDYYLFTGDRAFLQQHALPFMEKAALFFEDYLYEGPDGKWIFSPTQSPENSPSNTNSQATFNATMDVAAAKQLLQNLIATSRELGVNTQKIPVWQRMLEKMPPYLINEEGAIKEWLTPVLADNYAHRHASQLYPLYDRMPDEIRDSPALQAGFKRLIELKLERHWRDWQQQRGYMSFGLVQLGQAAATLGESELAYRSLVPLVNRYWLHNMASTHNYRSLFNMDISGGLPAVVIQMLVASEPGSIRLLPARPAAWPSGAIEGVLCRGQVQIKRMSWNTRTISLTLLSARKQQIALQVPSPIAEAVLQKGDAVLRAGGTPNGHMVSLPAGQEVTIELRLK
jgi:hypothetical protein